MRRILFLDFDGVLNNNRWVWSWETRREMMAAFVREQAANRSKWMPKRHHAWLARALTHVDPFRVCMLNNIIRGLDVQVVISSAWRIVWEPEELQWILDQQGFFGRVIDRTPSLGVDRGLEIADWIKNNGPVDRWVVLDDSEDAGESQEGHFVKTDGSVGLEPEHVEMARKILGAEED